MVDIVVQSSGTSSGADQDCPVINGYQCLGRGQCSDGTCLCSDGFKGSGCEIECPLGKDMNTCLSLKLSPTSRWSLIR